MIRCIVIFEDRQLKIKVADETTVAGLIYKLRAFYRLEPEDAIFLFFQGSYRQLLYPNHKLLSEIATELSVDTIQINNLYALKSMS